MPRYNIEHKGKYYIFSTICDGILEKFDSFKELQEYRKTEYGNQSFDNEKTFKELKANKMELQETLSSMLMGGNVKMGEILSYFKLLDKEEMIDAYKDLLEYAKDSD